MQVRVRGRGLTMPCYDAGPTKEEREAFDGQHREEEKKRIKSTLDLAYKQRLDDATRAACEACEQLEGMPPGSTHWSPFLIEWWDKHQKEDRERKEKEHRDAVELARHIVHRSIAGETLQPNLLTLAEALLWREEN